MEQEKWTVEIVWIPCSEQMPEYGSRKLLLDKNKRVWHGICCRTEWPEPCLYFYPDSIHAERDAITHWAHYPTKP